MRRYCQCASWTVGRVAMILLDRAQLEKAAADCGSDLDPQFDGATFVLLFARFLEALTVTAGSDDLFVITAAKLILLPGTPRTRLPARCTAGTRCMWRWRPLAASPAPCLKLLSSSSPKRLSICQMPQKLSPAFSQPCSRANHAAPANPPSGRPCAHRDIGHD